VAHHRDVDAGDGLDGVGHHHAALQLHALGAFLHQADAALHGLLRADLVAAEGQIAHDQCLRLQPGDEAHVVRHLVELDRNGVGGALHHHAHTVAHQDDVDAGRSTRRAKVAS
jgi:hypothetical protein